MKSASFNINKIELNKNRAIGHISGKANKFPLMDSLLACGGLYINAVDLGKFLTFQLNDGKIGNKQILAQKYIKIMRTIPERMKNQTGGHALGIDKVINDTHEVYYHGGTGTGFRSRVLWISEYNFGIAITVNSETARGSLGGLINKAGSIVENNHISDKPAITDFNMNYQVKKISEKELNKWIGSYIESKWYGKMEISFNDGVFGIKEYGKFLPLKYIGNHRFHSDSTKTLYIFHEGNKNYPKYIQNINSGKTWDYNDSLNNKLGPNKESWQNLISEYKFIDWRKQNSAAHLYIKNGYLYVSTHIVIFGSSLSWSWKLKEFKENMFVTCNGVVFDLSKKPYTFNSLKMTEE
jgi:hypothetical protein